MVAFRSPGLCDAYLPLLQWTIHVHAVNILTLSLVTITEGYMIVAVNTVNWVGR